MPEAHVASSYKAPGQTRGHGSRFGLKARISRRPTDLPQTSHRNDLGAPHQDRTVSRHIIPIRHKELIQRNEYKGKRQVFDANKELSSMWFKRSLGHWVMMHKA